MCSSGKWNAHERVSICNENPTKKSIRKLHLNAHSTPMWSKVNGQSREYLSRYTETKTDRHELNPQISSSSYFLNSSPQKRNSHEPRFIFFSFSCLTKTWLTCASLIMLLSQRKQAGNKSSNRNALASQSVPERPYLELCMEPVTCRSISLYPIIPRKLISGWTHPQERVSSYLCVVCVSWGRIRRGCWVGFDAAAFHVWNKLVRDFCQDVFGQPRHT